MMNKMIIDGIEIVSSDEFSKEELLSYVEISKKTRPNVVKLEIFLTEDGQVKINWASRQKFERIRRITGYLVGTIDRWNNAKQSEESERVKHDCVA